MPTLTQAQRDVLERLMDGWFTKQAYDGTVELVNRDGSREGVSAELLDALLAMRLLDYPTWGSFRITDAGRDALGE